jgi:N-acetylmuramoyl-L-alanine amidase
MTSAWLTASAPSPQLAGSSVTFAANGSGGATPYAFKWWVQRDGGAWALLRDWSTNTTFTWTPKDYGTYVIGVWGRSAGATADLPQVIGTMNFVISDTSAASATPPPSSPMTSATLTSDRPAVMVGTTAMLAVKGTGGTTPYSFKWWAQRDGGAWTLLRDWSTSTSLAWSPAAPGTYVIGVWARSAGATADVPQTIGAITLPVYP